MVAEARGALAAALAGVHVEELAGHADDLAARARRGRSAMPSLSGGGRSAHVAPDVERPVGRAVDAHAQPLQPRRASGRASRGRRRGWPASRRRTCSSSSSGIAARCSGCEPPPSRKRARARDRLDHLRGPDRPGHAPARVAPVLGQAVEDHHRIAVDVLDVAGGALHRAAARAAPSRCSASRTRRCSSVQSSSRADATQRASSSPCTSLPVGLHGFEQQQRREPAALHLAPQVLDA